MLGARGTIGLYLEQRKSMHTNYWNSALHALRAALLALLTLTLMGTSTSLANVTGEGDVSPAGPEDLPISGGMASAPVIVGDTFIGKLTIDAPGFTDPLESESGIIGNAATGQGQVNITGLDLDQSAWILNGGDLVIGAEGQGSLNISNGGLVLASSALDVSGQPTGVLGDIIAGKSFGSQGLVNIGGFGSQLQAEDFFIGVEGFADINVHSLGTIRSDTTIMGDLPTANARLAFSGLGTRWFNTSNSADDVIVGNEGRATLEIRDQAIASAAESVLVGVESGSHGTVRIQGDGSVWLIDDDAETGGEELDIGSTMGGVGEIFISENGLLQVSGETTVAETSFLDLDSDGIINSGSVVLDGVLRGNGRVESTITVNATGEIRNYGETPVYAPEEALLITGEVTNDGTIEALGGEMEFESLVTNNSEVVARDTVVRFPAGMTNTGTISVGGDTTLHGDITGSGSIFVLSDSESLLVGDLTFTGGLLAMTVGTAAGTLDVAGAADLTGTTINLDYSAGIASQTGDSYQIFQADGGITGAFPTIAAADGRIWDITLSGTDTLIATAIGVAAADFNGDGIVNDIDLNIWDSNYGMTGTPPIPGDADGDGDVDGDDFLIIQGDFGGPPSIVVAAVAAVPEPSTLLLASLIFGCCITRRLN